MQDRNATANGSGLLAGRVDQDIQIRIIADRGDRQVGPLTIAAFEAECLSAGQKGEIVVRGRHVLPGYLNSQHNSKVKIQVENGVWHRTGDAGYVDAAERLWLLGRCCARVEDDYGRLYPLEIEGVVRQRAESCRVVLTHDRGQRVLLVDRRGSAELQGLRETLRQWNIERVKVVDSLPFDKRHRSKIDYSTLNPQRSPEHQLVGGDP
jgi:acyl-CoA synthetase (AMP-forming)/AMP-acid ligase II